MTSNACITVTIDLNNPELDAEEQDEQVLNLITGLEELEAVDTVGRVLDQNPPEGNKSLGGFVVGLLMAEVSVENFKKLMGFVGDRIGNKPIKLRGCLRSRKALIGYSLSIDKPTGNESNETILPYRFKR